METNVKLKESVSLASLAKTSLIENDNLVAEASAALFAKLLREPDLLAEVVDEAIEVAVRDRVRYATRTERSDIIKAVERAASYSPLSPENIEKGKARAAAHIRIVTRSLLDLPLPGGRRLGDASRSEVMKAAEFYVSQSTDMAHKGRWLRAVGQSTPEGAKVADVMTSERAAELFDATRAVAAE